MTNKMLPTPTYQRHIFTQPSTGKRVEFRPYTVGEEKLILNAIQAENTSDYISSIRQIIDQCSEADSKNMTGYDIAAFFMELRKVSVGESVVINLSNQYCPKENGSGPCEKPTKTKIDLNKVDLYTMDPDTGEMTLFDRESFNKGSTIQVDDKISILTRAPNIDDLKVIENEEVPEELLLGRIITFVIEGDKRFDMREFDDESVIAFIKKLPATVKKAIQDRIDTVPTLYYKSEYKCAHCDYSGGYELYGINDFFA